MRLRTGHYWTEEDDEILRKMAASKSSAMRIAARLRRSVGSVRRRASELKLHVETTAATRRNAKALSQRE